MALIAGGIGAGLVLLIAAWNVVSFHHGGGVPVIEAEAGPVRVKPENPGGMQLGNSNEDMLADAPDGKGKLDAPAEAPQTARLRSEMRAAPPPAPPLEATEAPPEEPVSPPHSTEGRAAEEPMGETDQDAAPDAAPPPAKPAEQRTEKADKAEKAEAAASAGAVVAPLGATQVQLAALDSESAALQEWRRLQHSAPDLLTGKHPIVTKTERSGRVFYRRTSGFADIEQATIFCQQLRAKGAACSVASF